MGDKPVWEQIGTSFIQHYYQLCDNNRTQRGAIYIDPSCHVGRTALPGESCHCGEVVQPSVPENPTQHHRIGLSAHTRQLHHQRVVGQLKADEDPIMGFHQIFLLKNINGAWVCTNDGFRPVLHNFG
uniref:NTF2 domain-containing protein n=1 Tax=Rhinolophus ferrumequinum TaxID=59479 RepID=A0A671EJV0_RHIFE